MPITEIARDAGSPQDPHGTFAVTNPSERDSSRISGTGSPAAPEARADIHGRHLQATSRSGGWPENHPKSARESVLSMIRNLRRAVRRAYRRTVDLSHPARSPLGSAVVNCVGYEDGVRQAGSCPAEEALRRVRKENSADAGALRLDRAARADATRSSPGIAELFDLHPLAVEDAVEAHQRPKVERYDDDAVRGVQDGLLRRARGAHGDQRGGGHRRDHGVRRRGLRDHRPARPARLARSAARGAGVRTRAAGQGAGRGAARDRGPRRRRLPGRHRRGAGRTSTQVETAVFAENGARADAGADLPAQARTAGAEAGRGPARAARSRSSPPGRSGWSTRRYRPYFRDVSDHLLRVNEQIAAFDELLNSILQAHLAQVTVAQNEDMRKITAWAAIIAVPTMVCGVYGMNFEHMPELHWTYGYPLVLGVIAVACFVLYRGFRRNGWL